MTKLKSVEDYLIQVPGDRGTILRRWHKVCYLDRFDEAKASSYNHQAWAGGYRDHLTHMLNFAESFFVSMADQNVPKPDWESVVLAIYFHDVEKMFKYARDGVLPGTKEEILTQILPRFGLTLTEEELHAIRYAHGEGDDYCKDQRVMSPLGAIVHAADILSARWLFDQKVVDGHLQEATT
jgi:hypothetical protein